MDTQREFLERIAELTKNLEAANLDDPDRFFGPTLQTMAKDSARWLENQWAAPNGSTTPVERAIVVLTQDLIVLLGHAAKSEIRHPVLTELAQTAVDAAKAEVIQDDQQHSYFTHPDSPLHSILADQS